MVARAPGARPGRWGPPVRRATRTPRNLELASLYIDQDWYGTGMDRSLVLAVIGEAPASVWVTEDNARARRFYEKLGFVADGAAKVEEHLRSLREIRMVR